MMTWRQRLQRTINGMRQASFSRIPEHSKQSLDDLAERLVPLVVDRLLARSEGSDVEESDFVSHVLRRIAATPTIFGGGWDRVSLGRQVKLVNALLNVASGRIIIGDFTFLGHNVSLLTGTHDVNRVMQHRQDYPENGRDIVIGKGVWVASNATVLGPCLIGDNVVVAAGAVVVGGELDTGCLYAGVPARKIRKIDD